MCIHKFGSSHLPSSVLVFFVTLVWRCKGASSINSALHSIAAAKICVPSR